jgi:FkbM family methyltransferase
LLKQILKKIHIIHNIHIKHKLFIKKESYSMEGEDLIISQYTKNIKNGFYVDAGCYHPLHLNNTYLLHKKNWNGINIDLSEFSISLFNYLRPNDVNVNSAVSNKEGDITFYYQKQLSQITTTKKNISQERMQGFIKEKKIKAFSLNSILNNSKFKNRKIDFLNVDVEGADLEALQSLNFNTYKPKIICVEIIERDLDNSKILLFLKNLKYKKIWSSGSGLSHIFLEN